MREKRKEKERKKERERVDPYTWKRVGNESKEETQEVK